MYLERHADDRARFQEEIANRSPTDLVYVDESGIEEPLYRPFGRAPRGTQVYGEVSGRTTYRLSLIAALNQSHLLAPMRFEGYCDTEVFNAWVAQALLPSLKPGQTVIMDNASFHKSSHTQQLIASKDGTLQYLPTYSPALNPIETHWAILKARLRKHAGPTQSLEQAIDQVFALY